MMYWKLFQLLRESLWQSYYWHSSLTAHYDHAYVEKRRAECCEDVTRTSQIIEEWLNGEAE